MTGFCQPVQQKSYSDLDLILKCNFFWNRLFDQHISHDDSIAHTGKIALDDSFVKNNQIQKALNPEN